MTLFVWLSSTVALVMLLSLNTEHCVAQECANPGDQTRIMNAPAADGSAQVLSGDLQLLIPAWRLNETGFVYLWQAIVQGNASNSAIEFQIFEPNLQKKGVYDLIYGNRYNTAEGSSQSVNNISVVVDRSLSPPLIPVRPGYVVGIRLRNNTPGADPSFGLQYINSSTGGVEVYYWQGMGNQTCSLSTCDSSAGVLRGVLPLLSWRFCLMSSLTAIEFFFSNAQSLICSQVSRSACPLPSTTITPTSTWITTQYTINTHSKNSLTITPSSPQTTTTNSTGIPMATPTAVLPNGVSIELVIVIILCLTFGSIITTLTILLAWKCCRQPRSKSSPHHDSHELTTQPVPTLAVNNIVTDTALLNTAAANKAYDYPLLPNIVTTNHGTVIYTTVDEEYEVGTAIYDTVDEEYEVSTQPVTTTTNEAYGATIQPLSTTNEAYGATIQPLSTTKATIQPLPITTTTNEAYGATIQPLSTTNETYGATIQPLSTTNEAYGATIQPLSTTNEAYGATIQSLPITTTTNEAYWVTIQSLPTCDVCSEDDDYI